MSFPWFLSMAVGFLSLSQEILWMRYVSFTVQGSALSFSFVLFYYLIGIAAGAFAGRKFCAGTPRLYRTSGIVLAAAGALDAAGPLLVSETSTGRLPLVVPFILLCSGLKSVVFPIAHHLGSPAGGKVGGSVSRVYFMNIVGATMGPLLTGFWLLDHIGLQQAMILMAIMTALLGIVCGLREDRRVAYVSAVVAVLAFLALLLFPQDRMIRNLAWGFGEGYGDGKNVRRVIETRSGIIHSVSGQNGDDFTLGGNIYDGRSNINPRTDSNGLERIYILGALRPEPEHVLMIGLSSGAWARILTEFPGVKSIDIVEINPGYLQLIQDYPDISAFLKDPRVHVFIDDGRRWLKRHPDNRYDLVVMNTTYHWRAYGTNLLSKEFVSIMKSHLNQGGIVTYNTTYSPDALKTAEQVFSFAFRYGNFVVAADSDFRKDVQDGRARLLRFQLDGKPVFTPGNPQDEAFISRTLSVPFTTSKDQIKEKAAGYREGDVITDWNMIPEFKNGEQVFHVPR